MELYTVPSPCVSNDIPSSNVNLTLRDCGNRLKCKCYISFPCEMRFSIHVMHVQAIFARCTLCAHVRDERGLFTAEHFFSILGENYMLMRKDRERPMCCVKNALRETRREEYTVQENCRRGQRRAKLPDTSEKHVRTLETIFLWKREEGPRR